MAQKKQQKQGIYRLSDNVITFWTRFLLVMMAVGILGGFAFAGIVGSSFDGDMPEWVVTTTGILMLGVGVALPLLIAAILGGVAIHRFGPIGTVLLVGSIVPLVIGRTTEDQTLAIVGLIGVIAGGVLTFYLGIKGGVPIWLQLPSPGSPRMYLFNKPQATTKKKPAKKTTKR